MDVFQGMKSMRNHKMLVMTSTGITVIEAAESLFVDEVRIYDSEVLLGRCSGKRNEPS